MPPEPGVVVRGRQAEQAEGCCPPYLPSATACMEGTASYGAEPDSRGSRSIQGQSQQQAWQTRGATSGGGHKSRTLLSAVEDRYFLSSRKEDAGPSPVPPASNIISQPGAPLYLPPPCYKLFALSYPKVLPCPFFFLYLMKNYFSSAYSLPDPALCPGGTVWYGLMSPH